MSDLQPVPGLHVVMSFSHENFSELYRIWRAAASARGENVIARLEDGQGGGKVQVIDWATRAVTHSADIVLATGFAQLGDELVVCGYDNLQFRDRELNLLRTVSHRLFCNLHSVTEHPLGLVVAASSIDALLLVTPAGEVSTYWNALEHGYDVLPGGGRRRLDPAADHRGVFYLTGEQTTHINGTTYWPARETVLATLFHQGHLVEIDPAGRTRVLLDGLAAPHSPRIRDDGLVYLADSRHGRIVEYDGTSGRVRYVTPSDPCPWLQTVSWVPDEELYLAADSTNGRAMLVRPDGTVVDQYGFHQDWRLHEARPLEPSVRPAVAGAGAG